MYSLRTAAKATGISKATIHRYIQSGKISARRKEDGFYEIDPSELHRVLPPVSTATSQDAPVGQSVTAVAHIGTPLQAIANARLEAEIAGLRQLLQVHKEQVDDLRCERDRLIGTVEGAQRLLTHEKTSADELAKEQKALDQKALDQKARRNWGLFRRSA